MKAAATSGEQTSQAPAPPRFLVVDDHPGMARALALQIRLWGGEATTAGTVRAARKQLARLDTWSGIILDLSLPDGSGLDVLAWVREKDQTIAVLVHTGHSEHDAISAAFDLRAEYLEKPTRSAQIAQFLQRAKTSAEQRRARDERSPSDVLPEDLSGLVARVLVAASDLGDAQCEYAYLLATLARAARGRSCGSWSAMEACARAVNVSRQLLQQYATVASRWEPAEVKRLLGLHDRRGRPVTISHLLRVAQAPRERRAELEAVLIGGDLRALRVLCGQEDEQTSPARGSSSGGKSP